MKISTPINKSTIVCLAAIFALLLVLPTRAAPYLEEDFESYTSGAALPTGDLWTTVTTGTYASSRMLSVRESDNVYPGDGSYTVPQSPFSGGSQMLEFWDNYGSGRLSAIASFAAPDDQNYPLTIAFDYRIDETWSNFSGTWRMQLYDSNGGGGYYVNLLSGTDPDNLDVGYVTTDGTVVLDLTPERDVWYHVELVVGEPTGIGRQPADLSFWKWGDADTESTFVATYEILGRAGFDKLDRLSIGDTGTATGHWYVDNLSIVPEPTTLMLLGLGALALLRRRRLVS